MLSSAARGGGIRPIRAGAGLLRTGRPGGVPAPDGTRGSSSPSRRPGHGHRASVPRSAAPRTASRSRRRSSCRTTGVPTTRAGSWCWTTAGRSSWTVVVLLGRNPQARVGEEDAQLIKVADDTRTVSKSHLALSVDHSGIYVMDRGSTNGSSLPTGRARPNPVRPVTSCRSAEGGIVSFGDHWLEIRRRPVEPADAAPTGEEA